MPYIDVSDTQLFYTEEGAGDPPILFIHGYTCDSHDWSWQIPHFSASHRVIAPDNRGHGRSGVPGGGYDPFTFASDLSVLLRSLDCGPVVAIGHSLGGVIVSVLAVEHPDLVRAVVSIDPGYLIADEMADAIMPLIESMETLDPALVARSTLDATHTPASPPEQRIWHARRAEGTPPHVVRQTLTNLMQGMARQSVSAPYLARRTCPILAMYADVTRATSEQALLRDDGSRVITFEGSGHWLHQERPAEVNLLVGSWIDSLDTP